MDVAASTSTAAGYIVLSDKAARMKTQD